jgi:hypothetical protein
MIQRFGRHALATLVEPELFSKGQNFCREKRSISETWSIYFSLVKRRVNAGMYFRRHAYFVPAKLDAQVLIGCDGRDRRWLDINGNEGDQLARVGAYHMVGNFLQIAVENAFRVANAWPVRTKN